MKQLRPPPPNDDTSSKFPVAFRLGSWNIDEHPCQPGPQPRRSTEPLGLRSSAVAARPGPPPGAAGTPGEQGRKMNIGVSGLEAVEWNREAWSFNKWLWVKKRQNGTLVNGNMD